MRTTIILVAALAAPAAARAQDAAPISSELRADIERHVRALASRNGWVSLDALDYLPYFGKAAVPPLLEALRAESPTQRALACVALARIPDRRAIPALLERLEDAGGPQ